MRHIDITSPCVGTATHPYLAAIVMDPVHCDKFQRTFEDKPTVKILGIDRSMADEWTVYAACASRSIQDLLESNW